MTGAADGPGGAATPDAASWEALAPARQRAGLSMTGLYLRYVALGGSARSALLSEHVSAGAPLATGEHDLAVLALNERFLELGDRERLPYER